FDYLFTDTSTVTFNTRFEIVFRRNNVTGLEEQHYVNTLIKSGTETLTIIPQGFQYPIVVDVCDLLGRQLLKRNYEREEINLPKWNEPVIIRISDKSNSLVKKVF
ncbi:MAG: hypothetical protein JNL60_01510, partial [Bacteroidia bacterium]|nr:hypothetical protein [Bacteroidia bacterium]